MLISNINIVGQEGLKQIHIKNGKITAVSSERKAALPETQELQLENAIVFPGLINPHDHLDFNLFPRLGNRIYNNYEEWGHDIHQHNSIEIQQVLKVPRALRTQWGIYKNLFNGFTTVFHHGTKLPSAGNLIDIHQNTQSLHSTKGEKYWKLKINFPYRRKPVIIHAGEGTDAFSNKEINDVLKWNLLRRSLVGVHGVAMDQTQAARFMALIWCPDSNFFTLGKTARIDQLKNKTTILFGTDSTLTASWNAWEQLRMARSMKVVSDQELYEMITLRPAALFGLQYKGRVMKGYDADLVIAKCKSGSKEMDKFFSLNPEDILMVIHQGHIRMYDDVLHEQLTKKSFPTKHYSQVQLNGSCKHVEGDLPQLLGTIKTYGPDINLPLC